MAEQLGWTALDWAALQGRTGTVRLLLENGADVDSSDKVRDV